MRRIGLGTCILIGWCVCILGFAAPAARGQSQESASIVGQVVDASGASIPNVKVSVTSPALQVPQVTTTTDADGNYKVLDLPAPGAYRASFELQGFQTFVRADINLTVGFSAKVDATMKVGEVTQTVEVSGASPVVDTVNTAGQTTLQEEQIQVIPKGELLQEMMPMVAGLNLAGKPDVGDSNLAARAATITYGIPLETTLGVEGLNNTMDHAANSSIYLDSFAIEEVEFKTSGNNADVAFPGVDQVAVMKSGSNSFHGSVRGAFEKPGFQSNNITSALAGPPSNLKFSNPLADPGYYEYAADIGGRIIRDKLWFYGGYSKQYVNQESVGFVGAPGAGCAPVVAWIAAQCATAKPATIFAYLPEYNWKLSYQLKPSIKIVGSEMRGSKHIPNQNGTTLEPLPTDLYENEPDSVWKVEIQIVHPRWLLDVVGGYAGTHPGYIPEPAGEIGSYGFTSGSAFAGDPAEEDLFNKLFTGTDDEVIFHIYDRHEMTETFSYLPSRPFLGGTHQLKFGTTWDWEQGDTQVPKQYPSGDYLLLFNSASAAVTTPTPFEITVYNYPNLPINLLHAEAGFITDTWSLKHVTLNLGVRGERYNSFYPKQVETAGQFADVFPTQTVADTNTLTWVDVVPRAGVAWDIRGDGKTVLKGSFGMFGDTMGFLYSNLYNPASVQSKTYSWTGPCAATAPLAAVEWQCDVTPAFLTTLPSLTPISQTGGSSQIDNTALKQDKTFEYVVKLERQLVPNVSLSVSYIRHAIYDLFDSETNGGSIAATTTYVTPGVAVGHPYSSYTLPATFTYTLNGVRSAPVNVYTYAAGTGTTSNEILNTPSGRPDVYNSIEVALTKRFSKKWDGLASFWTTKDHRWIEGLSGITGSPNDDPFPIDNTWNWEARGSVSYKLPLGFTISSLYRATSGAYGQLTANFTGTGTNGQKLNQGSVTMREGPFGQYQGPLISVLNLKFAKDFHLGETRVLEANFQYFNLLNSSAAVATSYAASTFGQVTTIESPRVFRIGGVFTF